MAAGDVRRGPRIASGELVGTGASIQVQCGFKPAKVLIFNVTDEVVMEWTREMADGKGYKRLGVSSGTIVVTPHADSAGTPAGTNDAPAITVTADGVSAGTPAGTNDAPAISVSAHADTAGTPSEATAATVANALSAITPGFHQDIIGVTKGTPKLLYNADPVGNLAANPLFVVEGYGIGNKNIGVLQSIMDSTTSIVASTDDVSGICGAATPRFFVAHSAAPSGVQIYVDQADNDKLVCVSPTGKDVIIMMPFEAIADGVPGFSYAVTIHHVASIVAETALYFDDDGAANSQLCFVDIGTTDSVIYASDIEVIAPACMSIVSDCGQAAAQIATVTPGTYDALADHSHASTAVLDAAPVFSGSALAVHQHADTAALDAAPVFSGSALANHSHASTAAFTGAAGESAFVSTGGITGSVHGFSVGDDADLNVGASVLYWIALRF